MSDYSSAPAQKSNTGLIIAIIVGVLLLCCCCSLIGAVAALGSSGMLEEIMREINQTGPIMRLWV